MTARNLERRPFAVAHLDDPREVVIVEGATERLGGDVATWVVEAYERKYGRRLDRADEGMPFFVLRRAS